MTAGWLYVNNELRKMIEAARVFDGLPLRQAPDWLDLRRGERLLWLGSDGDVVETRGWKGLTEPSYADLTTRDLLGPFDRRAPSRLEVMGTGPIVVTDQRVVVATRPLQEWTYSSVDRLAQLPNVPCTLLGNSGSTRVSGLLLDPANAPYFRFSLALALADQAGRRGGLVALLERHLASHQLTRPARPVAVEPKDVPNLGWWLLGLLATVFAGPRGATSRRRLVHLGATVAVLFGVAALVVPRAVGGPDEQSLASLPNPGTNVTTRPPSTTPTRPPSPTPTTAERPVTRTEAIPFETRTVRDPALEQGKQKVRTAGVPGVRQLTYQVTYASGRETARRLVRNEVLREPVTQVVAIGSREPPPAPKPRKPACDPNYGGACVPIASDVDCAGSREDGPAYVEGPVYVIGRDIYRLDRNRDGVGCDPSKRRRVSLSRSAG
ncbi:G5 domain-containing protein [Flindersiella endophytica]